MNLMIIKTLNCDKGQLEYETVKRMKSNVLRTVLSKELGFLPGVIETYLLKLMGLVRAEL